MLATREQPGGAGDELVALVVGVLVLRRSRRSAVWALVAGRHPSACRCRWNADPDLCACSSISCSRLWIAAWLGGADGDALPGAERGDDHARAAIRLAGARRALHRQDRVIEAERRGDELLDFRAELARAEASAARDAAFRAQAGIAPIRRARSRRRRRAPPASACHRVGYRRSALSAAGHPAWSCRGEGPVVVRNPYEGVRVLR